MNDILEYKNYYAEYTSVLKMKFSLGKASSLESMILSFEGSTVTELKKEFQEAVEDYLTTCKELAKEPEKAYKGSFNIRIPSELHRQAARQASLNKLTLNDFVRKAIDAMVSSTRIHERPHDFIFFNNTFYLLLERVFFISCSKNADFPLTPEWLPPHFSSSFVKIGAGTFCPCKTSHFSTPVSAHIWMNCT